MTTIKGFLQDCPAGQWNVGIGDGKEALQPNITVSVATEEEVETCRVDLEREAAHKVKGSQAVRIAGATGMNAALINGIYEPTEEMSDQVTVFRKVDDEDMWLEYIAFHKGWQLVSTANKGTNAYFANCDVHVKCLPQDCPVGQWNVCIDGELVIQRSVAISLASDEEVEAYRLEREREAAHEVKGSQAVRIAGVKGLSAPIINGVYKPSLEMSNNVTVFCKVDDEGVWLEYRPNSKQWQVTSVDNKGTDRRYASCTVPAKGLPQDCDARQWQVIAHGASAPQPGITITVVSDEEAQSYCLEIEQEAAREVKGSQAVRIAGATGPNAGMIDGIYVPTDEKSANVTMYVKAGDRSMWLEYHSPHKEWQVKEAEDIGTNNKIAYGRVNAKALPQDCPLRRWRVDPGPDTSGFGSQPAITISVVSDEEVEAYRADVEREAAREVKGSQAIRIAGVKGLNAVDINGVYQPDEIEMSDNVTVYTKMGNRGMWLEYHSSSKEWQMMRGTVCKSIRTCLASCAVPVKGLPQDCPVGQWQVLVDGTLHVQRTVTLSLASDEGVEAYRLEVEQKDGPEVKGSQAVRIEGATGMNAVAVNGIYEAMSEMSGSVTMYAKAGDRSMWLEYSPVSKQWQVKSAANKGTEISFAYNAVPAKGLPESCFPHRWRVLVDDAFHLQRTVTISVVSKN